MNKRVYKRIFLIVIDSLGVGELNDAQKFGDIGVNTLKHISQSVELKVKNLESLSFGNIIPINNVKPVLNDKVLVGKLAEVSNGKDTLTGHFEMMGLKTLKPAVTFTDTGFPQELLDELSSKINRNILGNKAASGTEILDELGEEHIKTGSIIVYTSADSVLQIAAHEDVISVPELYKICEIAREITMKEEWKVGRVIARPFIGNKKGDFKRTSNRHDYALKPFDKTVLNFLSEKGFDCISVGKINDIFVGEGITEAIKTTSNFDGMEKTISLTEKDVNGLIFVNLVDFDAVYGHRRNPVGYGNCIMEFDEQLGTLIEKLNEDDLLIITADHGNDPTFKGTDHTREYVPLIAYSKSNKVSEDYYLGETFADIGATIAENFEVLKPTIGTSFLNKLQ